jgi:hypothetical protein
MPFTIEDADVVASAVASVVEDRGLS